MVTVNRFFCFRLHTAGVVIGWLGAALSLLNIITYSIVLSYADDLAKKIVPPDNDIPEKSAKSTVITILSVYITINIIDCVASILLICGTIKERHLMIVPWLLNNGISLIFNMTMLIGTIVMFIIKHVGFPDLLAVIVIATVILGIQLTAWLAMYSLFKLIRMSTEQQRLIPDKSYGSTGPSYTRI